MGLLLWVANTEFLPWVQTARGKVVANQNFHSSKAEQRGTSANHGAGVLSALPAMLCSSIRGKRGPHASCAPETRAQHDVLSRYRPATIGPRAGPSSDER